MRRVGAIAPTLIPVGSTAEATLMVRNISVFTGTTVLAPYTFTVAIEVAVAGIVILSDSRQLSLAAGETKTTSWSFTPFISGAGVATASLLTTDGVTVLATAPPFSFTVISTAGNLLGHVDLQGRPAPPNAAWITPLTVVFFTPGTNSVVRQESVVTDNKGDFTITNVALGTYDIGVKCPRSLSELVPGVIFAGASVPISFGPLKEGDADNNDTVTGADYSVFWYFYGATSGVGLDKCDFNRDGVVSSADYSLLYANVGQVGDMYGRWP